MVIMFWQISDTQHSVDQSRYRIEVLEKSLKMRKMPDEERCVPGLTECADCET